MRLLSLLIAASLVVAAAARVAGESRALSLNPPLAAEALTPVTDATVAALGISVPTRRTTNAERFAHGLPPLPPRRMASRRTPTRVQPAARAGASPTAIAGVLAVRDGSGNGLGYVSATFNGFGEYGITTDASAALQISASAPGDGGAFEITATNAQAAALSLIGAVVGFQDTSDALGPGSYNYLYLGGTAHTAPGAMPAQGANSFTTATNIAKDIESVIWTYNAATGEVTPVWVNPDGSVPVVQLAYFQTQTDNELVVVADAGLFNSTFGPAPIVHLFVASPPA